MMIIQTTRKIDYRTGLLLLGLALSITLAVSGAGANANKGSGRWTATTGFSAPSPLHTLGGFSQRKVGWVPNLVSTSSYEGPVSANDDLSLSVTFQARNGSALEETLSDLYDPTSPNFHHWLTPEEF
jgi:hypothetical protein